MAVMYAVEDDWAPRASNDSLFSDDELPHDHVPYHSHISEAKEQLRKKTRPSVKMRDKPCPYEEGQLVEVLRTDLTWSMGVVTSITHGLIWIDTVGEEKVTKKLAKHRLDGIVRLPPMTTVFLPMELEGVGFLREEGEGQWRVVKSDCSDERTGISYAKIKYHEAIKVKGRAAKWGQLVQGEDEGDGWIRLQIPKLPKKKKEVKKKKEKKSKKEAVSEREDSEEEEQDSFRPGEKLPGSSRMADGISEHGLPSGPESTAVGCSIFSCFSPVNGVPTDSLEVVKIHELTRECPGLEFHDADE